MIPHTPFFFVENAYKTSTMKLGKGALRTVLWVLKNKKRGGDYSFETNTCTAVSAHQLRKSGIVSEICSAFVLCIGKCIDLNGWISARLIGIRRLKMGKMNVPCMNIVSVIQRFCIFGIVQSSCFFFYFLLPLFISFDNQTFVENRTNQFSPRHNCSRNSFENKASLITPILADFLLFCKQFEKYSLLD